MAAEAKVRVERAIAENSRVERRVVMAKHPFFCGLCGTEQRTGGSEDPDDLLHPDATENEPPQKSSPSPFLIAEKRTKSGVAIAIAY
jgi:hypothetical protein